MSSPKAADPETGVITIEGLRRHIENQMAAEGRQLVYSAENASQIGNIKIAVLQKQFNKKIAQLIEEVDQSLNQKLVDSSLVDIRTLTKAVKKVRELKSLDPKTKKHQGFFFSF